MHSVVGRGVQAEITVSGSAPETLLVGSASGVREEQLGRGGAATGVRSSPPPPGPP